MEEITPVTVVFITATECGACKLFKTRQPKIIKLLETLKNVNTVSINLNKTNDPLDKKYPSKIKKYHRWFPFIFMTGTNKWETNSFGDEIKILNGCVKNGKSDWDKKSKYQSTPEGIKKWVQTERPSHKIIKAIVEDFFPYDKEDFGYESVSVYKGDVYKGDVYKGDVYKGDVYKGDVYKGDNSGERINREQQSDFNILSAYDVEF